MNYKGWVKTELKGLSQSLGFIYTPREEIEARMSSIGEMPGQFVDAYKECLEIHDSVLAATRPGSECHGLFRDTLRFVEKLGYRDSYLGHVVGHGIGLELA